MRAAEDASSGGGSSSNSRSAAVFAIELVFGRLVAAGTVGGWEEAEEEEEKEEEGEPRATLGLGSPPPPAQGYLICLGNRYFQRGTREGRRALLKGQAGTPRSPLPLCTGLDLGRRGMRLSFFSAAETRGRLGLQKIAAALTLDTLPFPLGMKRP